MNDGSRQHFPEDVNAIFSRLNPRDVEQFYRNYQLWSIQQQIGYLQTRVNVFQQHIAENDAHLQEVHPSPIALAALARLQSNGVNDIGLLDRMLDRGEAWLDQTMQRLDYCEKFAFISDNYTEWCEHALDGAYDWIDSAQASSASSSPGEELLVTETPTASMVDDASDPAEQITEAMLLEKLMSDEADEAEPELDTTLKRPVVTLPQVEEAAAPHATEGASRAMAEVEAAHPELSEVAAALAEESAQAEINEPADSLPAEAAPLEILVGAEQVTGADKPALAEQTQETLASPSAEEVQNMLQGSPAEKTPDEFSFAITEPDQATLSEDFSILAEDYMLVEAAPPLDTSSEVFSIPTNNSNTAEQVVSEPVQAEPLVADIQSSQLESMNIEQPDLAAEVQEPQEATEGVLIESAPEGVSGDEPTAGVVTTGEEVIPVEDSEAATEAVEPGIKVEHLVATSIREEIVPGELDAATAEIAGDVSEHATEEEQAGIDSQAEGEITPSQFAATPTAESAAQVEQADAEVVAMPANETVEVEQLDTIPVPVQEKHSGVEAQVDEPTLATAEAMEHSDLPSQENVADTQPTNTFTVDNWTPDEGYQGEAAPQRKRGFFQWFFDLFRSR
jgi:hypothetical protein